MKKLAALPFSEHAFQTMVCEYMARAVRPELHWTAIPNGGKRDMQTAVKLKAEGVRRGSPDIVILLPEGRAAWLELKAKGGSLSIEQKAFRDVCKRLGHYWAVAKTLDEVISYLAKVGATRITKSKPNQAEGESK